jgi:hypothetical protein
LLERLLIPNPAETEAAARLASIDEAMGAFAHVPTSSEEFSRRKQEEIDLEEAKWARRQQEKTK